MLSQYCGAWRGLAPIATIGMNDGVAMLSISTQSRTKHGNSCKVFSGAPNTLVGGGAHLFSSTHRTSSARNRRPRSADGGPGSGRRQRGLWSVKSGGEVAMKMTFVLVNGRTPSPQSFCALCCEPIGESYLRDITSGTPTAITSAMSATATLQPRRSRGERAKSTIAMRLPAMSSSQPTRSRRSSDCVARSSSGTEVRQRRPRCRRAHGPHAANTPPA